MKIAIYSHDDSSSKHGFYNKVDGLINAAKKMGLDYTWIDKDTDGPKYDVVINWDPFSGMCNGTKLTVVWEWDTYRVGMAGQVGEEKFDLLFRAHATHFCEHNVDPRPYPTYWVPPAVDMDVFKREEGNEPEYDIVFVGTRRPFPEFDVFRKNFNTLVIDEGRMGYPEYIEALNKGKLILNAPVAHETNKRVMEAMSIGPALMSWGPDYTLLATPQKHFVCYKSMCGIRTESPRYGEARVEYEEYLTKLVRYCLKRPKLLKKIQKNGRQLIKDQFTFEKQVERIEEIMRHHIIE